MADVKLFSQLTQITDLDTIANNRVMALESDPKGAAGWKPTIDQLKNICARSGLDATVGPATSGADYNDINTAIAASKYNLLIIGAFTQPTQVSNGSNFIQIAIVERLKFTTTNFNIGSAGIRIRGGEIETSYTSGSHDFFTGTGTLDVADVVFFDTSTGGATVRLSNMSGIRQLVHNCKFVLPDNDACGFHFGGDNSSFTNLNFIGGGSSCNGPIRGFEDVIIDDIHCSGPWDFSRQFMSNTVSSDKFILTNMISTATGEFLIFLTGAKPQISNLTGRFTVNLLGSSNGVFSDLDVENLSLDVGYSQDNHYFTNCKFNGTTATTLYGDSNQFVNCKFNPSVTLPATSNNNQFSLCASTGGFTDLGTNNSINLTNINSAGMLEGGAITDAGGETIDVTTGSGYLRTTDSHTGILVPISWPAATGIAIPTDTVRYVGVDYNAGSPIVIIKSTDLWDKHTEFRLGSVVNENTTLRLLDNPWMIANAEGHAIERFFETLPFKRADRIGGLIIGETGPRQITVTAGEIYDLTNEFPIAAIDTSVSGGFDSYAGLTQFASGTTQWDNQNYNNGGVITALAVNKWATLWWYLEADGKLVMNYGIVEHNTQAAADLEGEPPVRPVRVQVHGTLIGRTIFQKSAVSGDFQSAFITQFAGAGSSDHLQLSNLTTGDAGHTQFLPLDGSKSMTGDLNMIGGTNTYKFHVDGQMDFWNQISSQPSIINHYSKDGDGTDITGYKIYRKGNPAAPAATQILSIISDTTDDVFQIVTSASGGEDEPDILLKAGTTNKQLQLIANDGLASIQEWDNDKPFDRYFQRIRGSSIVQSGDGIVAFRAQGWDGSAYKDAATIKAVVAGTPGANDMPGKWEFYTTPDGSATPGLGLTIEDQDVKCEGTGALRLASGTTAERPVSPINGDSRNNITTGLLEFYQNGAWVNFSTGPGPGILDKQDLIFVNKAGNDSNSGLNEEQPKLTIGSAITAASAQSPASNNPITVKVMGGGAYSESFTVPSWVMLDAEDAAILGQITCESNSFVDINSLTGNATSEAIRCTGITERYIKLKQGIAGINGTIISSTSGATIYLDADDLDATAAGAKVYNVTIASTLYLDVRIFRETVASVSTGSTVFRNIVDDGSNADTTSINEVGDQFIRGKDKVTLGTAVTDILELNGSFPKWISSPLFIAYNSAQISNLTGDGTIATIVLTSVDANIGTHYNTGTGIFTAPTTGIYSFNIVLVLNDMNVAAYSDVNIRLVRTGTAATWWLHQSDPDKDIVGGYLILNGSATIKLNSGDTAKFQVQVVGGAKSVDVEQGTTYSGQLITKL